MKRRAFLKNSIALTAAGAAGLANCGAAQPSGKREYYELRAYKLKAGAKADSLHEFLKTFALPALQKAGAGPIGVFDETPAKDPVTVFVLVPYPDLNTFAKASEWLGHDSSAKNSPYLAAPKDNPSFDRIDAWLLKAFAGMPKLEVAPFIKEKKDTRLFELRTYESATELKALKKIAMFNDGEMQVMREVGLAPVFYGEALTGSNLPHLTYMTGGESEQAHKQHWESFGKHPKWNEMKNDPQYADTVSKITKWMLKPAPYSQM